MELRFFRGVLMIFMVVIMVGESHFLYLASCIYICNTFNLAVVALATGTVMLQPAGQFSQHWHGARWLNQVKDRRPISQRQL